MEVAVARVDVEFSEGFLEFGIGAEKVVLFQGKLGVWCTNCREIVVR